MDIDWTNVELVTLSSVEVSGFLNGTNDTVTIHYKGFFKRKKKFKFWRCWQTHEMVKDARILHNKLNGEFQKHGSTSQLQEKLREMSALSVTDIDVSDIEQIEIINEVAKLNMSALKILQHMRSKINETNRK